MRLWEKIVPLGIPLAWLNLVQERKRFIAALFGITFAVTLMLFQMGLNSALFLQVVAPHQHMAGDLVVVSPHYEYFGIRRGFPQARLLQAEADVDVTRAAAVYSANLPLKHPKTGALRDIFVIAYDPAQSPWKPGFVDAFDRALKEPGTFVFDRLSQAGFGDYDSWLAEGKPVETELAGRHAKAIGTFEMGTTFAADGNLITGLDTFLALGGGQRSRIDIGLLHLRKGADAATVAERLNQRLLSDVQVLPIEVFIQNEQDYWSKRTPIGFVIGASMLVALIVGAVIVYQILYTDVNDHLEEYATLKSIGFRDRYFTSLILQESLILGQGHPGAGADLIDVPERRGLCDPQAAQRQPG